MQLGVCQKSCTYVIATILLLQVDTLALRRIRRLMETSKNETLVHVVLVTEKRIESEPDLYAYIGLAFSEQLVPVSATSFKLRDTFSCSQLTHEQWLKPKFTKSLRSWLEGVGKGVRDLPTKSDINISEDLKSGYGIFPTLMSDLVASINPTYATSTLFTRKWSVIDGPQVKEGLFGKPRPSKILAIGVYSK